MGDDEMERAIPEEETVDGVVIRHLLSVYPAQLTTDEVVTALVTDDYVEPLLHDGMARLVRDGLAHRNGEMIVASRAAVRMDTVVEA